MHSGHKMQPTVTDGVPVAWCGVSVCWPRTWAVQKRLNRSGCRLEEGAGSSRPTESGTSRGWVLRSPTKRGNFGCCPAYWKASGVSAAALYAAKIIQQVRPFSGTAVYRYMPILRPHAARYITNVASLSVESAGAWATRDSSDFGLLGEQSSPKCEIPYLGRRWTAVQNLTPYSFIRDGEIRNRTNTHKKQTQTNSNRYIHTLPIGMWIITATAGLRGSRLQCSRLVGVAWRCLKFAPAKRPFVKILWSLVIIPCHGSVLYTQMGDQCYRQLDGRTLLMTLQYRSASGVDTDHCGGRTQIFVVVTTNNGWLFLSFAVLCDVIELIMSLIKS